jgi:hypothetical protein
MPGLQIERSIPESATTFDALATPDAKRFVDRILKIGILDIPPADRADRTQLVLRRGRQTRGFRREIPGA